MILSAILLQITLLPSLLQSALETNVVHNTQGQINHITTCRWHQAHRTSMMYVLTQMYLQYSYVYIFVYLQAISRGYEVR